MRAVGGSGREYCLYIVFFLFTVQGAEVLGSVFYRFFAFLILHIRTHNVGDGRCAINLHFLLHVVYDAALLGRERFRSIDIQVDSSSARQQSLFRSIVVPCEIKSCGHSGRFDLNSMIFSSGPT